MTVERDPLHAGAPGAPPRLGATPLEGGRTRFIVWAPAAKRVEVVTEGGAHPGPLAPLGSGYHGATLEGCPVGTRYRYRLDGGQPLADPASRCQPEGVLGPSQVVDLAAHRWRDGDYRPRPLYEAVIWECHIGTLTREGTFDAAVGELERLADLGVTAIELMPVAEFPGVRNWGYDGVFPFAVQHSYGGPAGLQRLVDAAHERDLAVVLDVVYNHIGPVGNVLGSFGPYFTKRYATTWGPALNFDGPDSDHVRAFFLQTVAQWFGEFHVDALRLDAIHAIVDSTAATFVADLGVVARRLAERLGRPCPLIAESSDNDPRVVTPGVAGGIGLTAQWNDDFHHALHAALTGERQGYYADFGSAADLARAMRDGFVYQGEYSVHRRRRHGAPSAGIDPERFVLFAQNHDHIGNRPRGERLAVLVDPPRLRLAAALLLLSPGVPLLFMGEEYGETAPFAYFVDHGDPELAEAVRLGRKAELATMGYDAEPLDASDPATFENCVIDTTLASAPGHREILALYRRLLALRRRVPALARSAHAEVDAWAADRVLTLSRCHAEGAAVALFNLGATEAAVEAPGLLTGAAPAGELTWCHLLDSSDPELGGTGPAQPVAPRPGDPLVLAPWGFVLYEGAPARPGVP